VAVVVLGWDGITYSRLADERFFSFISINRIKGIEIDVFILISMELN